MTCCKRIFVFLFATALLSNALVVHGADLAVVGFDVPAIVIAEQIDPAIVDAPTVGGKLVRLRFPVSAFVTAGFRGSVREYLVEIESPHQSMRVVDFWPRNEVYSEVDGTVAVENLRQKDGDFTLNASGGWEPFGRASVSGNLHDKATVNERFQRKPPMQILTSSGTIRRGYGVFFRFRPGPMPVAEGAREVALLAEVPVGWRADLLKVTMRATGSTGSTGRDIQELGGATLWVTTHHEADQSAAWAARKFVSQERTLRRLAASSQQRVEERALPTFWHKVGAAFDIVEPKIPTDYLDSLIFASTDQYLEGDQHRLPIDLRVAVLDFWDAKRELIHLAFALNADGTSTQLTRLDRH